MITFKLYGHLGKTYGKLFNFEVKSISEGISLFIANFHDFKDKVLSFKGRGYAVFVDNSPVSQEDLCIPLPSTCTVKIVPIIQGSGGSSDAGIAEVIVGAILIVVGTMMYATPYAPAAPYVQQLGVSLLFMGIMTLMYQAPPEAKNTTSFGSIINSNNQGTCVPLGYGRRIVGSAYISAGISTSLVPV